MPPIAPGSIAGVLVAACKLSAAGAFVGNHQGIASIAGPAASVYTITLAPGGIDLLNSLPTATPMTSGNYVVVAQTSDTVFTVSGFNAAGAATDTAFSFKVERIGIG